MNIGGVNVIGGPVKGGANVRALLAEKGSDQWGANRRISLLIKWH